MDRVLGGRRFRRVDTQIPRTTPSEPWRHDNTGRREYKKVESVLPCYLHGQRNILSRLHFVTFIKIISDVRYIFDIILISIIQPCDKSHCACVTSWSVCIKKTWNLGIMRFVKPKFFTDSYIVFVKEWLCQISQLQVLRWWRKHFIFSNPFISWYSNVLPTYTWFFQITWHFN